MPQVSCPHCGQPHNLTDPQWLEYQGLQISCTRCRQQFPVSGAAPPASRPMPYAPGAGPGSAPFYGGGAVPLKPNRAAFWALVFGCLSFLLSFLAGIPAVILGIAGMKKASSDRSTGGHGMALTGLVLGIAGSILACGFISVLLSILLPAFSRAREEAERVKCATSMRQIGLGLINYAGSNNGQLPPTLDAAAKAGYLPDPVPGCPKHAGGQAGATTGPATPPPGYVYVGQGMNLDQLTDVGSTVLLYEQPAHTGRINVLYADGHVAPVSKEDVPQWIGNLRKGVNPPPAPGGN